jgi:hypothetical protein
MAAVISASSSHAHTHSHTHHGGTPPSTPSTLSTSLAVASGSALSSTSSTSSSSNNNSSASSVVHTSMASLCNDIERMTDIEASWYTIIPYHLLLSSSYDVNVFNIYDDRVMMVVETGSLPRIVASGSGGLNALQGAAHTHLTATPKVITTSFVTLQYSLYIVMYGCLCLYRHYMCW